MAITKIEVPELFDFGSDNSAFKLPTGTTAERPTSPSNGEMRFNTTTGYVEYYDTTDTQWWEIDYETVCTTNDPNYPITNLAYYKMSDASDSGEGSGYIGQGGIFNGSSSNFTFTGLKTNGNPLTVTSFSVSMWVNFNSFSSIQNLISNINGLNYEIGWILSADTNGKIGVLTDNNASASWLMYKIYEQALSINTWYNLVFVSDGTNNRLYINGNESSTVTYPIGSQVALNANASDLEIGFGGSSRIPNGSIDQVRIFPTALSPSNVSLLYAETSATSSTLDYPVTATALYELSGNANDTGNTYNGTATNVEYAYNGTATNVNFNVAGKFGNAGEFNGSSSKVLPSSSPIPSSGAFTVSTWVKTSTSNICFISFGDFWLKSEYLSGVFSLGDLNTSFQGTTDISDNVWHHIALSVDASNNIVMYVDGISEDTGTATISRTNGGDFAIGVARTSSPVYYWNGSIDQIRIFDSALNASQVTQLYNEIQCVPTIVPSENFNTVLYNGNGSTQDITSVGFQPDFVWVKNRLTSAENHLLSDVASGFGKIVFSNLTNAQVGSDNTYFSQLSNGFSINTNNGNISGTDNYVAWSWKAGGAAVIGTGTGVTNVSVSANTDAGFSIIKFTGGSGSGQTVKPGLNSETEIYFLKGLDNGTDSWVVCGNSTIFSSPTTNFLRLNTTDSVGSTTAGSVGSNGDNINVGVRNYNGQETIAYAFHSVDGFSKIGSYTGNLSSETNVVTGFEPSFVMVKCSVGFASGRWFMWDNKRSTSNIRQKVFFADLATAEQNNVVFGLNFNSNGFSIPTTTTSNSVNQTGYTYIFMAFAADPT